MSLRKARRGELAGLGQPQAERAAGVDAALQQQLQHDRTAVALQFEHVLAGVGMRRRESTARCRGRGASPLLSRNGHVARMARR